MNDQDMLKNVFDEYSIDDIISQLQERYCVSDIIARFDKEDVLDTFYDGDLLDYLEDTCSCELQMKLDESFGEGYSEAITDAQHIPSNNMINISDFQNSSHDDKYRTLCDLYKVGYYSCELQEKLNNDLNNATYNENNY